MIKTFVRRHYYAHRPIQVWLGQLNVFNAQLFPKRSWRAPNSQEMGEERDKAAVKAACINCESQRLCPQSGHFEEKGEPKLTRTVVLLLISVTPNR